jgi:hypothetical protein
MLYSTETAAMPKEFSHGHIVVQIDLIVGSLGTRIVYTQDGGHMSICLSKELVQMWKDHLTRLAKVGKGT